MYTFVQNEQLEEPDFLRIPEHPIIDETSMIDPEPFKPHKVQKPQIPAVISDCSEYFYSFIYTNQDNKFTESISKFQNVENTTTMTPKSNLRTADKSLGGVLQLLRNEFK